MIHMLPVFEPKESGQIESQLFCCLTDGFHSKQIVICCISLLPLSICAYTDTHTLKTLHSKVNMHPFVTDCKKTVNT